MISVDCFRGFKQRLEVAVTSVEERRWVSFLVHWDDAAGGGENVGQRRGSGVIANVLKQVRVVLVLTTSL